MPENSTRDHVQTADDSGTALSLLVSAVFIVRVHGSNVARSIQNPENAHPDQLPLLGIPLNPPSRLCSVLLIK